MNVGDRIAEVLRAAGIPALFGVPGGQTLPLYQATRAKGPRHVLMRDERNAACAADAFARVSGRVGVCDATVGPGVTNLVSGLAEALASSVPILALVADIRTDQEYLRRRSVVSQATAQHDLLTPVTKWVGRVERSAAVDDVLDQALRVATTGRPGPVAVEIPEDVWLDDATSTRAFDAADSLAPRHRGGPDPALIAAAAQRLAAASRPVVLAGGGAVASGAASELRALVTELDLPVVTTINGKGVIDEHDHHAAGVVGLFGDPGAVRTVDDADVVLVVGSKLDQFSTHRWRIPRAEQCVIHVDVDGEELGRVCAADVAIVADARTALRALRQRLAGAVIDHPGWPLALAPTESPLTGDDGRLHPAAVCAAVDAVLGPDDVVVCDASYASGWAAANLRASAPRRFVAPRGLAGIGWSAGAAIGACHATAKGRVVVLAGDGGWAYGVAELETAARLVLDLTVVVLNNSSLAWIVHGEERMDFAEYSTFVDVDFAKVGRGFGARGRRASTIEDVTAGLLDASAGGGPYVLDVATSRTASPIISLRSARAVPIASVAPVWADG